MQANYANALCHLNATPLNKAKMEQCLGGGLLSLSLSLSLVARTFWHTKFFKRFIFGLLRPFCHFEPLQKGDPTGCKAQAAAKKSTHIKRKLAILGYFAIAQYDSKRVIASCFRKDGGFCHFERSEKSTKIKRKLAILGYFANAQYDKFRQKPKFDSLPHFNVIKAHNDGGFCHFECSEKSKEFKIHFVYGYFANAQYDKKECSVWQTNPYYFEQSALAQSPHANLFDTLFLV